MGTKVELPAQFSLYNQLPSVI